MLRWYDSIISATISFCVTLGLLFLIHPANLAVSILIAIGTGFVIGTGYGWIVSDYRWRKSGKSWWEGE